jgi:hypothetical protein
MKPDGFPHPAFHSIANRRFACCAGNRKTDLSSTHLITSQAECRKIRAGESDTLIIYFAEVAAAENAGILWEVVSGPGD